MTGKRQIQQSDDGAVLGNETAEAAWVGRVFSFGPTMAVVDGATFVTPRQFSLSRAFVLGKNKPSPHEEWIYY